MLRFDIITIFPEFFSEVIDCGILRRACNAGLADVKAHDLRQWTTDKHHVERFTYLISSEHRHRYPTALRDGRPGIGDAYNVRVGGDHGQQLVDWSERGAVVAKKRLQRVGLAEPFWVRCCIADAVGERDRG